MRLPEDLSKYHADYKDDGTRGGGWLAILFWVCSIGTIGSIVWVATLLLS